MSNFILAQRPELIFITHPQLFSPPQQPLVALYTCMI